MASSSHARSGSRKQAARRRWPELVLFKLLPIAVITLVVFTPAGQALQLKAAQMFGDRAAQVIVDGIPTPTAPAPAPGSP